MTLVRRLSGKLFGKYTLGDYLGYTGIAHVYQAVHPKTKNKITIQLLPNHFVDQPGFSESFISKATHLKQLRHPTIVHILDCGVDQGYPYLVAAHIEGPTLQDLVESSQKRDKKIPMEACLFIIQTLGSALSHAHKLDIPHGNLGPNNIVLEESGIVVVSDFGLYRIMIYKPSFPSKEVDRLDVPIPGILEDKQLDISAIGSIFYEIVTGNSPYGDTSTLLLGRQMKKAPPKTPSTLNPEIPPNLDEVILKTLGHDPENRYQSVAEMLDGLSVITRKVKTTMLPSAKLSELAQYSKRFRESDSPEPLVQKPVKKPAVFFPDNGQILTLEEQREYSIGRQHKGQAIMPDIDLTPLKGYEWGISRLHACLTVTSGKVTITDMGSSNGTWIAGERITPHQPFEIKTGETVMLGRLRMQVLMPE